MKHGSLFSGIGGFDLAAEWMGWENMFHCEWNEFGQKVLKHYWPNAITYGDITKTDFRKWRGQIDILTGGFPCQPFSQAGKRAGAEDDRYLWPAMLRAIEEIRPSWVVGENVGGITTMVQPYTETKVESQASIFEEGADIITEEAEFVIETICSDLERIGYTVQPIIIPACAVGAPHRRDRIWFIAHSESTGAGVNNRGVREGISGINDRETTKTKTITDSDSGRRHERHKCEYDNTRARTICEDESNNGDKVWSNFRTSRSNWSTSNSNSWRLEGTVESRRYGEYVKREGITGITPNTESTREQGQCEYRQGKIQSNGRNCCSIPADWENFPTQPPICGGNDGLPIELDGITFSKWRNESIKAYGNAIVPQVAYEIFKGINEILK